MQRGLPGWATNPWPIRLLVLGLGLAWLAFSPPLPEPDRDWFDAGLRWRLPHASPVSARIVHMDVLQSDLASWPETRDEYGGLASLIAGLRAEGAQVIAVDLLLVRGTPASFEPLRQVLADAEDVVLGCTWDERAPLPGSTGLLYVSPDSDGILRHYVLARRHDEQVAPSLGLAAYLKLTGATFQLEGREVVLDDVTSSGTEWKRRLPATILLDQRLAWETRNAGNQHLTSAQLAEWRAHPGPPRLAGKVVLLSYVASGSTDLGTTPLGAAVPKVLMHSMAINDLLQDTWHAEVPRGVNLALVVVAWAAGWWLASRLGGRAVLACWLVGSAALLVGGMAVVLRTHPVPALATVTALWTLSLAGERWRLGRLRELRQVAVFARADMEDPLVLKLVGRYQIVEKIGQGGFASVYRGLLHRTLDPDSAVAIKIVNQASAENPEFRRRFVREIRINSVLSHPSIVRVIDSGDQNGLLYLVMELLRGKSLRSFTEAGERWSLEDALAVLGPVMAAVEHAHQRQVLHRDLKPENVMVEGHFQTVKVVDFGLAFDTHSSNITKSGDVFGTLDYLAPERIQGVLDEPRSDQYALGVMAYEMLAGKSPFPSLTPGETILHRLTKDPPALGELRPDLPPEVTAAVMRMLARDHTLRFDTVAQAWEALQPR